jgi:hypothetical protein
VNHGFDSSHKRQLINPDQKIRIVAHSMGCLIVAVALMKGYIHPKNISRLICVGAPFLGAPSAFRALYSEGYIPGLSLIEKWVNMGKNFMTRRDILLEAIQTFESIYQLLPNEKHKFVTISNTNINPLDIGENIVSLNYKNFSVNVHILMSQFQNFLDRNKINYSLIHSVAPKPSFLKSKHRYILSKLPIFSKIFSKYLAKDTDVMFESVHGRTLFSTNTYLILRTKKWIIGDGTVPFYSSTLKKPKLRNRYLVNGVPHAEMCNSKKVVNLIIQFIS